jgi:gas vesicle structural protein
MADEEFELGEDEELSLLETLDHVLDRGLVIAGEVTIAVADVDLIYLGLNLLVGSVETVNRVLGERERRVELLRGRALAARRETDEARRGTDDARPGADGSLPEAGEGR